MQRTFAVAVTLAALSLVLLVVSTAGAAVRTEFFGIAQDLDPKDRQGMAAARVQTARFMLKWRDIERSGDLRLEREGPDDRWSCREGNPVGPVCVGVATWVDNGTASISPIGSAAEIQAWQNFLKAAVGRYGPTGSYWSTKYKQDYGQSAMPLPIQSWQIWNEPNLKKYFGPGSTTLQAKANKYARLLAISHDAIKAKDPRPDRPRRDARVPRAERGLPAWPSSMRSTT